MNFIAELINVKDMQVQKHPDLFINNVKQRVAITSENERQNE